MRTIVTHTHYACVTCLQIGNVDHTHWGQFLTPDSQFRTTCFNHQLEKFNSIFTKNSSVNGAKCCVWVLNNMLKCHLQKCLDVFRNLRKSSEHLQESSVMFRSRRNIFGNLRQFSEVIGNFSEIRVVWIRKSHAFDLGKSWQVYYCFL